MDSLSLIHPLSGDVQLGVKCFLFLPKYSWEAQHGMLSMNNSVPFPELGASCGHSQDTPQPRCASTGRKRPRPSWVGQFCG